MESLLQNGVTSIKISFFSIKHNFVYRIDSLDMMLLDALDLCGIFGINFTERCDFYQDFIFHSNENTGPLVLFVWWPINAFKLCVYRTHF
jgi:hypothetical protein